METIFLTTNELKWLHVGAWRGYMADQMQNQKPNPLNGEKCHCTKPTLIATLLLLITIPAGKYKLKQRWNNVKLQRWQDIRFCENESTLKSDVVSTLKFDVVSTLKFDVVSTLKSDIVSTLC